MLVTYKTALIASTIVFCLGGGLGYLQGSKRASAGPEMVTLVDREQVKSERDAAVSSIVSKLSTVSVKTVVKYRTGPVEQIEHIKTETNAFQDAFTQHSEHKVTKAKESVSMAQLPPRNWAAEAAMGLSLSGSKVYSAGVGYRMIGNVWAHVAATSSSEAFVGLRIEF